MSDEKKTHADRHASVAQSLSDRVAGRSSRVDVEFRRFGHSEWERGTLVGAAFSDDSLRCPRRVTVAPNEPEGPGAPTTLTVPLTANRLRVLGVPVRTKNDCPDTKED